MREASSFEDIAAGAIISDELIKIAALRRAPLLSKGRGSTRTILNSFATDRSLSGRSRESDEEALMQHTVPSAAPEAMTCEAPDSPLTENCASLQAPLLCDVWWYSSVLDFDFQMGSKVIYKCE